MKKIKAFLLYPIALFLLFVSSCGVIDDSSNNQTSTSNTNEEESITNNSTPGKETEDKPTGEHKHDFYEVDRTIIKCDESAVVFYQCYCGESYQEQIDSDLDHNFSDWKVEMPPTETTEGIQTRVCSVCKYVETEKIDILEHVHDYKLVYSQEADCENDGFSFYECRCKDSYTTDVIPALNHHYGEWEVVTYPTETTEGYVVSYCLNDDSHYESFTLPVLNETDYQYKVMSAPTCEEQGTGLYVYSKDNIEINVFVEIEKEEHTYGEWSVKTTPTASKEGQLIRYCNLSLSSFETVTIPKLDINNDEFDVEKIYPSTCTTQGYYVFKYSYENCVFTFDYYEPIDSSNHTYTTTKVDESCEHGGYVLHQCDCGHSYKSDETAPLGHEYGSWEVVVTPGKEEQGLAFRYCLKDPSHVQQHVLPELYQPYYVYETISYPTCTEKGVTKYVYENFDYDLYEYIIIEFNVYKEPDGHDVYFSSYREPTCVYEGRKEYYSCNRCGEMATDEEMTNLVTYEWIVIPVTDDHTYQQWTVQKKPTSTEEGTLIRYCESSYSHKQTISIPMLNKSDYGYTVISEPKCTMQGYVKYEFVYDGQTFEFFEHVSVLGHNYVNATFYNKNGHYTYCERCNEESNLETHNYVNNRCTDCDVHKSVELLTINNGRVMRCDDSATYIEIPSSYEYIEVKEIYHNAFNSANSLQTIYIPLSITTIDSNIFSLTNNVNNVFYKGTIENYLDIEFHSSANVACDNFYCLNNNNQYYLLESVEIKTTPETYGIKNIQSISTITLRHDLAILSATLQESMNLEKIYYKGNSQAWFQNDFTLLNQSKFREYTAQIYMMNQDGDYYFVKTIDIPVNVDSIDMHLYPLVQLESVVMSPLTSYYSQQTFLYCVNLESVYFKGDISSWCYINFASVTDNPMYHATKFYVVENGQYVLLEEAIINANVEKIPAKAFYSFECITSFVILGENTTVEGGALRYCPNITSLTVPFIGSDKNGTLSNKLVYLFDNNKIPSNLTEFCYLGKHIDGHTFGSTTSIKTLKITNPEITGRVYIEDSLEEVYIAMDLEEYLKSDFYCAVTNIYNNGYDLFLLTDAGYSKVVDVYIPSSISVIKNSKLAYINSLKTVVMENSITKLESGAFSNCISLETIKLSNRLTDIGDYAFNHCDSLVSIEIPDTLQYYGSMGNAFNDCLNMTYYQYENGYYLGNKNNNYMIFVGVIDKNAYELTIHKDTKFIAEGAIQSCINLLSLEIPENVVSIGSYAVAGCRNLSEITMYSNVKQIYTSAFYVTSADVFYYHGTINDYLKISYSGAEDTSSLVYSTPMSHGCLFYVLNENGEFNKVIDVVVSEEITNIGDTQFFTYDYIKSITLHNKVTSIGNKVFVGCDAFESIYFNGTLQEWQQVEIVGGLSDCTDDNVVVYVLDSNNNYIAINA